MMSLKIDTRVLDDLCSRFLLNIPQSEKEDMVRLCFQIELAHWFYLDFFRPEDASLPDCRMREFATLIFVEYPFLLNPPDVNVENVLDRWKEYKRSVPTYGAVLLDSTLEHVLLVQGFWIKASWGFPKGKVNKSETPEACAAREVLEETGFNITGKIDKTQFAEHHLNEQLSRLYYVSGVPMDIKFKPKTRGEIKNVQWFAVDDLPAHKKDNVCKRNLNMAANCFFMVIPFVKQMRRWIASRKPSLALEKQLETSKVASDNKKPKNNEDKAEIASKSSTSTNVNKSPAQTTGWSTNKIKPESARRQAQQFSEKNNQELEIIKSLTKDTTFTGADTRSQSPQQRRKVYGRGRGERFYKQQLIDYLTPNTEQRRGRGIAGPRSDFMPEAWKNFTFNRENLKQAIMAYHK